MLEELFENIKVYGRYVRKNNLKGLDYWNLIKTFIQRPEQEKELGEINNIIKSSGWNISVKYNSSTNSDIKQIYDYVHGDKENELKIFGEEGDEKSKSLEHDVWEQYHFFLQLIRIPRNNPEINLLRLLQIAYNLGQLSVSLKEESVISSQAQEYFKSNNLDRLDSYIIINKGQQKNLGSNLQIKDFFHNINNYILEQMNLVQTGGGEELEPFYSENVEKLTKDNTDYRRVIYTGMNQQFVLMSIPPKDTIKMEIHDNHDQFIRIVEGDGEAIIGITTYKLGNKTGLIIPAGTQHQITNTSDDKPLKLYTIYSPPEHQDKLVEKFNPDKLETNDLTKNVNIDTESDDNSASKIIKKELNKIVSSYGNDLTGGYGLVNNKQIDYQKKYNEYKNKYITLKKFISKYH